MPQQRGLVNSLAIFTRRDTMSKTSSKASVQKGTNPPQISGKVYKLATIKNLYSNFD